MKKFFFCSALLLFIAFAFPARQGHCEAQTPEELVREFYIWYTNELNKAPLPELNNEIYNYVHPCTVNKLRIEHKMSSTDSNYFIKGNDHWPQLFTYITAGKVVKINDDVSIVPFGFGESKSESAPHLAVFIQKEDGVWRIIKVEDTRGH